MRDPDPLRQAGRARRVHHIDEVVGVADRRRVGLRVPLDLGRVPVDAEHRPRERRQAVEQRLLRHEHRRGRLLELVGEACRGVLEVERHVRAAGLQDREEGDDHLRRAVHAETDGDGRTDAERPEMVREPVRARAQLAVGQAGARAVHRDQVGGRRRLPLEEAVDALLRVVGRHRLERVQQPSPLLVVDQVEVADRGVRVGRAGHDRGGGPRDLLGVVGFEHGRVVVELRDPDIAVREPEELEVEPARLPD